MLLVMHDVMFGGVKLLVAFVTGVLFVTYMHRVTGGYLNIISYLHVRYIYVVCHARLGT